MTINRRSSRDQSILRAGDLSQPHHKRNNKRPAPDTHSKCHRLHINLQCWIMWHFSVLSRSHSGDHNLTDKTHMQQVDICTLVRPAIWTVYLYEHFRHLNWTWNESYNMFLLLVWNIVKHLLYMDLFRTTSCYRHSFLVLCDNKLYGFFLPMQAMLHGALSFLRCYIYHLCFYKSSTFSKWNWINKSARQSK